MFDISVKVFLERIGDFVSSFDLKGLIWINLNNLSFWELSVIFDSLDLNNEDLIVDL